MAKKVGNTLVPRNPVAKSPLMKRGGAHAPKRTTQRSGNREALQAELGDWREDLEDLRRSENKEKKGAGDLNDQQQSKQNDET